MTITTRRVRRVQVDAALAHKERRAAGKSLRDKAARASHAVWQKPHRRDAMALLVESSRGRVPQLVPIRYGRMMESPFAFFRGAAAIMAADLSRTPSSGVRVQVCGDCHLMNFGGFSTPERNIVFDIDDFDETLPGPWEWDVKRLATSFVVAGRQHGCSNADARKLATRCVRSYRSHMHHYAGMGILERWHERIEMDDLIATTRMKKWKQVILAQVDRAASRSVLEDDFTKLVGIEGGRKHIIRDTPPLIFHQTRQRAGDYARAVRDAFQRYRSTLTDERKDLLKRYAVEDVASKVAGIGSVGMRCGVLLLVAGPADAIFLQVKEARAGALEAYAGRSRFRNCGQRVVAGQRLMQSASDMFLGWTTAGGRDYYIRQLREMKIKLLVEPADPPRLAQYAEWCGWALARAHAKSGDAGMISGYLGNSGRFDKAVTAFAAAYADQNERDYRAMLKAIQSGKLHAIQG